MPALRPALERPLFAAAVAFVGDGEDTGSPGVDESGCLERLRAMVASLAADPQRLLRIGGAILSVMSVARFGRRDGIRTLGELWFAAGARRVRLPFGDFRPSIARRTSRRSPRFRSVATTLHCHRCTRRRAFRLGAKDRDPVRPDGRVRGAHRIRVADGLLFPSPVGVPPQVTIMTLGAFVARNLVSEIAS
ncbi:MAG: hypothetical protein CMJ83_01475 [Planctomycetes bacterium]|nr:hypothetical protein [Planctomycetota bacterium]